MNQYQDSAYYLRREAAARDLATRTGDMEVRKTHLEMADRYAELAHECAALQQCA